jgi:BCCT family betaine/carnitine transporter
MQKVKIDRTIFISSILLIIIVCIPLTMFPAEGTKVVNTIFNFITSNLGVIYLWAGVACLIFLLWLAFSKHGSIVLGNEGEKPQFSLYSWVCMLFCAGVATGILYWGTIEWTYYYESPPYGAAPHSIEAIEWASTYGMFHWGLTGWAFYALPAVAIGYFFYIRKIPYMRVSTSCYGIFSHHAEGFIGKLIDVTFMVGLIGATGTSLGLGTPMIAAGLSRLFGIEESFALNVGVVLVVTAIFATTVYIGLEKGIKRLADINMALAICILIFVLAAGPTIFLLKMGTNSLGIMFQNFIRMNTWTDPLTNSGFVEDWTVFYWAWWIAVGPFMGIFLAEISRGRTIRQIVLGSLFFGSFGCAIYYIILGNYALHLELNDIVSVTGTVAEKGAPAAIITVIASLPLGKIILAMFCIVSVIFMATTYNSSSYALASCASSKIKSGQSPAKWHRLFWAFALALLPLTLMFVGDLRKGGFESSALESLKTASLVVSLPLLVVFVIMAFSLAKALRQADRETLHQREPEN